METNYRICPTCDFFCNEKEADKFCSVCGKELIEVCQSCKKTITNPYAKYCKHCGTAYRDSKDKSSINKF